MHTEEHGWTAIAQYRVKKYKNRINSGSPVLDVQSDNMHIQKATHILQEHIQRG